MVGLVEPRAGTPVAEKEKELVAFGDRLRTLRTAAGLSQAALGELVGVHRVHVARLESGTVDVPLSTLHRLASVLGVLPGDLLNPPPPRPRGKRK